jgi:hypothetical protein
LEDYGVDGIKMYLSDIGGMCVCVFVRLAQDRDRWRVLCTWR